MKLVKPLMIILAIVVVLALIIIAISNCSGCNCVQRIDKTLPDNITVPYEVATRTHVYPATKATKNDDGSVTMWGWYEKIDNKWSRREGPDTLLPVLRPRISRR